MIQRIRSHCASFLKFGFCAFCAVSYVLVYFCEKGLTMLTKLILEIDGVKHEIPQRCVKNWDEVRCAYKRADYSGITRSFTSQFEFVNEAYDMLINQYLRFGINTVATLSLYTITDRWDWEERFTAPIDFSSISWNNRILKVNCIDNSLAALIKSRKSTSYEFTIGKDIIKSQSLIYDRVKMLNTVTHSIVGDGTTDVGQTKLNEAATFQRLATYLNNDESFVDSPLLYEDENTNSGAFMLSVVGQVDEFNITTDILFDGFYNVEVRLFEFDSKTPDFNESYKDLGVVFKYSSTEGRARRFLGKFENLSALKSAYPIPPENSWAGVGIPSGSFSGLGPDYEKPYYAPDSDDSNDREWCEGTSCFYFGENWQTLYDCHTQRFIRHFTIQNPTIGKRYALFYKTYISDNVYGDRTTTALVKSTIKSQWFSRAKAIDIDVLKPQSVASLLLNKISDSRLKTNVHISNYDSRLQNTFLVAAESIRGIKKAKLYTSFNDFCNWMGTVFGYTYYLGAIKSGVQDVYFVHRSEIFNGNGQCKHIDNAIDVEYSIDKTNIYSVVEIGYEKKDYETECGRDEWNFTQYYNTGIDIAEKKLVMQSKYRADCYGFEFLSQERNQDTTDNQSDKDIFFVYCNEVIDNIESNDPETNRGDLSSTITGVSSHLVLNRSSQIEGSLTDTVFNGEFSPFFCIKANEGYISTMAEQLTLQFASSDGNSNIVIDGVKVTDNIQLYNRLFSLGSLSFLTDFIDEPASDNDLVEIENNGIVYRGFIEEATFKYAINEAVKYKLIVKDIDV